MKLDRQVTFASLRRKFERFWSLSADKIRLVEKSYDASRGSPVFTVRGRYESRGWTEWTQGFQYGAALLQAEATADSQFLEQGRRKIVQKMAPQLTHFGVHDHGFNIVSTYGALLRLASEGTLAASDWERRFYELALKTSAAVQARRWSRTTEGGGYIYSFNGPHSLFIDTLRSLRSLALGHLLGHFLLEENENKVSLLDRLRAHARSTANYCVYYGKGRDAYDIRGRVAHEAVFNVADGSYRCPNSQQGFSPFSTWTRGLAWAMCGFAEQLEFLRAIGDQSMLPLLLEACRATCDFYIQNASAEDGIPYWDTSAPNLHRLGDWLHRPADPFNDHEPVDSSAASIAAQGLLRLGHYLGRKGSQYRQAGLTVINTLLDEPYLSTSPKHQGLILHSVYHRPNGWDYIPPRSRIPRGESSMWGDYHAREAALYFGRLAEGKGYLTFFSGMLKH
jgi:unsaturated chondroitin disaccharide hydrolase